MKVLSLFLGVFVCAIYVCQTKAHITIQLEPNEIDQIVNILQTMIHQNHNIQNPSMRIRLYLILMPLVKSLVRSAAQMTAIMMTLVGANLITTRLESPIASYQMMPIQQYAACCNPSNVQKCLWMCLKLLLENLWKWESYQQKHTAKKVVYNNETERNELRSRRVWGS